VVAKDKANEILSRLLQGNTILRKQLNHKWKNLKYTGNIFIINLERKIMCILKVFSTHYKLISLLFGFYFLYSTYNIHGQIVNCDFVKFDDREFRILSTDDVDAKRQEIIHAIWGSDKIPSRSNVIVTCDISSPLSPNSHVDRVDKIEIPVERVDSLNDLAYLFIPVNRNNRLILFCPGHTCRLNDLYDDSTFGIEAAIIGLLSAGFDVLSVYMPHVSENDCDLDHCKIINTNLGFINPPVTFGLRLFLDPAIVGLNYLLKQNNYHDVNMIGLSGGGWTTNIIAAVDQRIKLSFCVAGSMPIYYRYGGSIGDIEQYLPQLYQEIAGYPDIYILNAYGQGRKLIHIFNRYDSCCFGEKQHDPERDYLSDLLTFAYNMKEKLATLECESHYRLVIDDSASNHRISKYALESIILPGLREK
jgi:hypothetical protein